jgi:FkbM family methyltransferase
MNNTSLSRREVQRDDILSAVSANIHYLLPEHLMLESRDPFDFLFHPLRFDLMFKYIYADAFIKNRISDWFKQIYATHIKVLSPDYEERDGSGKKGLEAYFESFHTLINSLNQDGFDEKKSLVVVSDDNLVVSGAHRVAAAAALKKPIIVARVPYRGHNYSFDFFRKNGLSEELLDYSAFEYCRLNKKAYVATVFPKAKNKDAEIVQILETIGEIYYSKRIRLFNHGPQNLMKVAYADAPWIGTRENNYRSAASSGEIIFGKGGVMWVIVFSADSLEVVKDAKQKIRSLFSLGNRSIHINDTHEQTIQMAQTTLNKNSVHFLNWATPKEPEGLLELIQDSVKTFAKNEVDINELCVDGSAVMAAYGIRPARDIDFVHQESISDSIFDRSKKMGSHNNEEKHHAKPIVEIVSNPQNHFYFRGLKFLSLTLTRDFKAHRNEPKDVKDVASIDYFIKTGKINFKQLVLGKFKSVVNQIESKIPNWARYPYYVLRAAWRFAKKAYALLKNAVLGMLTRGKIYKTHYNGFLVCYSYDSSMIGKIKAGGIYNPELTKALVKRLKGFPNPAFLDIGANIGLISLNVFAEVPQTKIYAFEPDPHKANLLDSTITLNNLQGHISLFTYMLGDNKEIRSTGQGGDAKSLFMNVRTFDQWWHETFQPQIHAINIGGKMGDLWVLRDSTDLIQSCAPYIFLEIHDNAKYILEFFNQHQYTLKTLTNFDVNNSNIGMLLKVTSNFVACPRSAPGPF